MTSAYNVSSFSFETLLISYGLHSSCLGLVLRQPLRRKEGCTEDAPIQRDHPGHSTKVAFPCNKPTTVNPVSLYNFTKHNIPFRLSAVEI
jgi:hypothetical protein